MYYSLLCHAGRLIGTTGASHQGITIGTMLIGYVGGLPQELQFSTST